MNILITGASYGIGHALKENLEYHSHRVFDLSRTSGWDLRDPVSIEDFSKHLPSIDWVVLNSVILEDPDFLNMSYPEVLEAFEVSVIGHAYLLKQVLFRQAVIPKVLYILSQDLQFPGPYYPFYQACKAAQEKLAQVVLPERSYRAYMGFVKTSLLNPTLPIPPDAVTPELAAERIVHTFFGKESLCPRAAYLY